MADVIAAFDISPATARRDINKLNEIGKLRKVRNGAEATQTPRPARTPLNIHQTQHLDEKCASRQRRRNSVSRARAW